MRALFYADVHIGAGQRIEDQRAVLERIEDLAIERAVDCVIFGGDATHHRSVVEEIAVFQEHVDLLTGEGGRPFFSVCGNHDRSTMDVPSTLEVACAGFARASAADRPCVLSTVAGVAICALPWAPSSAIAALDPTGQVDDVARTAEEILMDVARGLRASVSGPAVLVLHWSLSGAITPTGADVSEFREVVLPTTELAEIGFDAVLAGHIHSAGPFGEYACPVLYAGSPAVCDFGEADTPHGVWIVEVGDGPTTTEFVPIEDRAFLTVGYIPQIDSLDLDCIAQSHERGVRDAIVRVRYEATAEEERAVSHESIKARLLEAGAHRIAGIHPTIISEGAARTTISEDVSVDDALAQWLATQEVDDDAPIFAAHHEIREVVR